MFPQPIAALKIAHCPLGDKTEKHTDQALMPSAVDEALRVGFYDTAEQKHPSEKAWENVIGNTVFVQPRSSSRYLWHCGVVKESVDKCREMGKQFGLGGCQVKHRI